MTRVMLLPRLAGRAATGRSVEIQGSGMPSTMMRTCSGEALCICENDRQLQASRRGHRKRVLFGGQENTGNIGITHYTAPYRAHTKCPPVVPNPCFPLVRVSNTGGTFTRIKRRGFPISSDAYIPAYWIVIVCVVADCFSVTVRDRQGNGVSTCFGVLMLDLCPLPLVPSPKSQAYPVMVPPEEELLASNLTGWSTVPWVGAVMTAHGRNGGSAWPSRRSPP